MKSNFSFKTEYNQFYIIDPSIEHNISIDIWNSNNYMNRIYENDGLIAVRTGSYGLIKLEIQVLKARSSIINFNMYDHVIETSFKNESGTLELRNCPDFERVKRIFLEKDIYRIRIYSKNLKDIDIDEDFGDDSYLIEIWKENESELEIIKQYID